MCTATLTGNSRSGHSVSKSPDMTVALLAYDLNRPLWQRNFRLVLSNLRSPGEGIAPADSVSDDRSFLPGHRQSVLARNGDLQVNEPQRTESWPRVRVDSYLKTNKETWMFYLCPKKPKTVPNSQFPWYRPDKVSAKEYFHPFIVQFVLNWPKFLIMSSNADYNILNVTDTRRAQMTQVSFCTFSSGTAPTC